MTGQLVRNRRHKPSYQLGLNAIVLGGREGNIGGAIAERLAIAGWIAQEDDCSYVLKNDNGSLGVAYKPPGMVFLEKYDACVITLGVTHMEPFSEVSSEDLHKVLYGSLEMPLECARRYVQARSNVQREVGLDVGENEPIGKIVFVGSYAHDHPFTHCTSYCVAKAGLDMACRSLAWELMPEGFDVHIVHPHHVQDTPMTDEVLKGMQKGVHQMTREEAVAYQHKDLRMPDLLTPKEIAEIVLFLLSNKHARWLSGNGLNLYGGVR